MHLEGCFQKASSSVTERHDRKSVADTLPNIGGETIVSVKSIVYFYCF